MQFGIPLSVSDKVIKSLKQQFREALFTAKLLPSYVSDFLQLNRKLIGLLIVSGVVSTPVVAQQLVNGAEDDGSTVSLDSLQNLHDKKVLYSKSIDMVYKQGDFRSVGNMEVYTVKSSFTDYEQKMTYNYESSVVVKNREGHIHTVMFNLVLRDKPVENLYDTDGSEIGNAGKMVLRISAEIEVDVSSNKIDIIKLTLLNSPGNDEESIQAFKAWKNYIE